MILLPGNFRGLCYCEDEFVDELGFWLEMSPRTIRASRCLVLGLPVSVDEKERAMGMAGCEDGIVWVGCLVQRQQLPVHIKDGLLG